MIPDLHIVQLAKLQSTGLCFHHKVQQSQLLTFKTRSIVANKIINMKIKQTHRQHYQKVCSYDNLQCMDALQA